MTKPMNTRTIRFSEKDLKDIEHFIDQNPVFDFSTIARIAIRKFIENPKIEVRGIGERSPGKRKGRLI